LQVILQHHPSRAALLKRTAHLNPIVVEDPGGTGRRNPWGTYRACLQVAAELEGPSMIMQDDCIPLPGWEEPADQARELLPHALIAYCVQGMLQQVARSQFHRMLETRGTTLLQIRPVNWVPALALGWTPALAQLALRWDEGQTELRENATSDDGRLFHFQRSRFVNGRVQTWITVPCLVDHPDDVPSVGLLGSGTGRGKRRPLALWDGSPIRWSLAALS
jgi:hypothetical protein